MKDNRKSLLVVSSILVMYCLMSALIQVWVMSDISVKEPAKVAIEPQEVPISYTSAIEESSVDYSSLYSRSTPDITVEVTEATATEYEEPEVVYVIDFTEEERLLFEQIVSAEAHPKWDIEGYFLIAKVVMNQLTDGYWGSSLHDVLTYPNNYSPYGSGRYLKVAVDEKAKLAVEYVLQDQVPEDVSIDNLGLLLYFCTDRSFRSSGSFHATQNFVCQYDNTMFFSAK